MTRTRFLEIARERDLELATLLASLHGVSPTQIQLWITTSR